MRIVKKALRLALSNGFNASTVPCILRLSFICRSLCPEDPLHAIGAPFARR
jgi:hypothetical protein